MTRTVKEFRSLKKAPKKPVIASRCSKPLIKENQMSRYAPIETLQEYHLLDENCTPTHWSK
jgi:hypothetical protein